MVIVKKIELNFEDTELETLYIHQGEKGRGYILVPPVDVTGLSCQVEIVKPDNTFVINDLPSDESGNIILEVPEQAGAVVGVGWYNISFFNDNTVVYTCYGRIQIDDHVINDYMIESIAEVNGYRFPQDFVTQGDIVDIADEVKAELIKDEVTADSSTWSSVQIVNYVDDEAVVPLERITTYSTNEKVVGKWIDGSVVYEITYELPSVVSFDASHVWIDSGLPSSMVAEMDKLIDVRLYTSTGYAFYCHFAQISNGVLQLYNHSYAGWQYQTMTVQYTKSSS